MARSKPYILVAGCSHSDSRLNYIDFDDFWPNQLAKRLNCNIVNLSRGGACASYVFQQLIKWLSNLNNDAPTMVVVQWPNAYRSMELDGNKLIFSNVNSQSNSFAHRLKYDPESFWKEWTQSIIDLNAVCTLPILNVCFESKDFFQNYLDYFDNANIKIHFDEKAPGKTWFFDLAARDNCHHSSHCHTKWTERMLTILNYAV
jgi:hypothetical protein